MVEARPKATGAKTTAPKTGAAAQASAALSRGGAAAARGGASATRGGAAAGAGRGAAAQRTSVSPSSRIRGAQRDDYECPVCLELCAQPVLTPCKHFMCFQCHKRVVEAGMTCPMCRAHFDKLFVPEIDLEL